MAKVLEAIEEIQNKQMIFRNFITGLPKETDMELRTSKISLKVVESFRALILKNLHLSCFGISKVVESDHPDFQKPNRLRKIDPRGLPLSYYLGHLGIPGFMAYAGFYGVFSLKKGEFVFVSTASVGQLLVQLAKLHGCYVVDLLKNKFGFDEAFNYKVESELNTALRRYFPQGIDIYFDNMGGDMLDVALLNILVHGRIAICGMIAQQSLFSIEGIHNLYSLIMRGMKMQDLLQSDYLHLYPQFTERLLSITIRNVKLFT
ncbi:hypothetical protein AMTRI_Chr06g173960 [Amborella trichopoda]